MAENHPTRKIGLVTFTDNIAVIGDGSRNETYLANLNDYDYI